MLNLILDHLVWLILAVILILFSLTIENFFQIGIFLNILQHATFVGLIAIGLSFCIIAGHMDLSVESVMAFAAMIAAWLAAERGSASGLELAPWMTLLVVLAFGALAGAFNGFLVIRLHINAFIVTLAMYIAIRGLGLVLTGGRSMYGLPDSFRAVATANVLGLPLLVIILALAYVIFHLHLTRTRFGRHVYLVGGNPTAPFRAGIDVERVLYTVFILSGVLAALAGWLLAARTNGATPNRHAVRSLRRGGHRRRIPARRHRPAIRRVRRRAAAFIDRHRDQRHGPGRLLHAGAGRPDAPRRPPRQRQDHDPQAAVAVGWRRRRPRGRPRRPRPRHPRQSPGARILGKPHRPDSGEEINVMSPDLTGSQNDLVHAVNRAGFAGGSKA